MKKYFTALGLILMLAGSVLSKEKAATFSTDGADKRQVVIQNTKIIAGQSIGPIRLGMGEDEVQSVLGKPYGWAKADNISGDMWTYPDLNLQISFDRGAAPIVTGIQTLVWSRKRKTYGNMYWKDMNPVKVIFQTTDGITLGSSSFDVRRAYSNYSYMDSEGIGMDYNSLGLSFIITMDHTVWSIGVYRPR